MESLGKERDLDGKIVNQGLTVYGNKGSTDQHAYVQQLREGLDNFFAVFIEVLKDRVPGYCGRRRYYIRRFPFWVSSGTRAALYETGRGSITLTLDDVSPLCRGFDRTVRTRRRTVRNSINVNAYHQPGVEAGKKAAENVIRLQTEIVKILTQHGLVNVNDIGKALKASPESIFKICEHLTANGRLVKAVGFTTGEARFMINPSGKSAS